MLKYAFMAANYAAFRNHVESTQSGGYVRQTSANSQTVLQGHPRSGERSHSRPSKYEKDRQTGAQE